MHSYNYRYNYGNIYIYIYIYMYICMYIAIIIAKFEIFIAGCKRKHACHINFDIESHPQTQKKQAKMPYI